MDIILHYCGQELESFEYRVLVCLSRQPKGVGPAFEQLLWREQVMVDEWMAYTETTSEG